MDPRVFTPAPKDPGLRPVWTLPFLYPWSSLSERLSSTHLSRPPPAPPLPGVGGHFRVHGGISPGASADSARSSCGALNYFSCRRLYSSPSDDTAGALPCRFCSGNVHRLANASICRSCIIPRMYASQYALARRPPKVASDMQSGSYNLAVYNCVNQNVPSAPHPPPRRAGGGRRQLEPSCTVPYLQAVREETPAILPPLLPSFPCSIFLSPTPSPSFFCTPFCMYTRGSPRVKYIKNNYMKNKLKI